MAAEKANLGKGGTGALAALERFVVDNDDLLALESRIGRFNIFDGRVRETARRLLGIRKK